MQLNSMLKLPFTPRTCDSGAMYVLPHHPQDLSANIRCWQGIGLTPNPDNTKAKLRIL